MHEWLISTPVHPFGSVPSMPCRHTQPYTGDVHPDDELGNNEVAEQCARCSRWFRLFTERDDNYPWHNAGYCSTLCRELDNPEER